MKTGWEDGDLCGFWTSGHFQWAYCVKCEWYMLKLILLNMIIWWFGEGDDDEDEESNYEVDIQKVKFDSGIWLKLFVLAASPGPSTIIMDDDL